MRNPNLAVALSNVLFLTACGGGGGASPTTPTAPRTSSTPDATIGPGGGTVIAAGGGARLIVPAGALAISAGLVLRASTEMPLDPRGVTGLAYEVGPAGTAFAVPATLVLLFDPSRGPSGTDPGEWRVGALAQGAWRPMVGRTDTATHEATTADLRTSGIYGVTWPGPTAPCVAPEQHQFDFWLGDWDYRQGSLAPGSNIVTATGGGCLVEEHYSDPSGVQGRSVSLLSSLDGRWHQTYLDSRGTVLALSGSLEGNRMVLYQNATSRFTWDPVDPNTVRYIGEESRDGGATWRVTLDSRYTRR